MAYAVYAEAHEHHPRVRYLDDATEARVLQRTKVVSRERAI
jgi:hypothetical protein